MPTGSARSSSAAASSVSSRDFPTPASPRTVTRCGRDSLAARSKSETSRASSSSRPISADAAGRARDAELWVAVEDDRVLGSVTDCPPGSPWREVAGPDEGEFRMLAVDPAAGGRGVATALVRHVLDGWRARGARAVVLSTLPDMAAAHRLYARFGFVRVPARDWSPVPGVELLVYELELSRAAT